MGIYPIAPSIPQTETIDKAGMWQYDGAIRKREERAMGKFSIRKTATGFVFDLRAANGEVVASSEVYRTRAACEKGIQGIVKCAPSAPVSHEATAQQPSNPRYEMFTDKSGEFRFRLRARNGKIIASSQGYRSAQACLNGIESVRVNAQAWDESSISWEK